MNDDTSGASWLTRTLGQMLGTPARAASRDDALHPALRPYAAKVRTAADAVAAIRDGDHVFVGTACATPRTLVQALESLRAPPVDVELVHFLTDGALPHDAEGRSTTRYRHRGFFVGADMRAAVRQGLADYVPISVARVPHLLALGRIPVDVALVQVSLPDAFGFVSLGVSVDIVPAALDRARLVIAEVNTAMPRSMGDSTLHIDRIDHLVPVATPVIEYVHHAENEEAVQRIARYIASIIDDGSTLQIGLGRYTNEALKYLAHRKDLGVHSDVITDAIVPLIEKGIVTGRRKTSHPHRIVTSFAMGTRRLYDLVDGNPLFSFQRIDAVCNPSTLAAQHRMVSVTQAFAIDLTGQACVDQEHGEFYGGLAAQPEFLRGAARSEGGKAIICLASTEGRGGASRIHATLRPGEGASIPRNDVHYVITEYGIAYLFGRSIRERAIALIQIAHPDHRARLLQEAQALGLVKEGHHRVRHLGAYPVEAERIVALKDRRGVLLRPAIAADAESIRALFHHLSDQDIYTRFFGRVRGLSDSDVHRLCNVDLESDVAFVAVAGTREDPRVVGHACYSVDPSTNVAETAFMIDPAWQGQGLGSQLQRRLAEHAASRGVRGFVAEIMATNERMIGLARGVGREVRSQTSDGVVRITAMF